MHGQHADRDVIKTVRQSIDLRVIRCLHLMIDIAQVDETRNKSGVEDGPTVCDT